MKKRITFTVDLTKLKKIDGAVHRIVGQRLLNICLEPGRDDHADGISPYGISDIAVEDVPEESPPG